ncbi:signal peptidase I [bacterium]|nr:signal peptidase I [bacterium]
MLNHGNQVRGYWGVSTARNVIGVIVAIAVLIALWIVQTQRVVYFQVVGSSMEPTLKLGDRYIMSEAADYNVGDVIVFREPGADFITKRIVAIGPAKVELRKGQLYVNGERNDPPQGPTPPLKMKNKSWDVQPGQYFVVGDNRPRSYDSRDYGPIELNAIKGRLHLK